MAKQTWENLAGEIEAAVNKAYEAFKTLPESAVSIKPGPEKWSAKEILGHLIDSAANNHHRFVRLQYNDVLTFADYEQPAWVRIQNYQDYAGANLLALWRSYNQLLAHIIRNVDEVALRNIWQHGDESTLTLDYVMTDYPKHMNHHLRKIHQQT